jgi:ribose transport system permease protein
MPKNLGRSWVVAFLVLEVLFFCFEAQGFASFDVAQLILFNGTEVFLLATAELFVIITGGIDLSVGFVLGFASVVSSKFFVALGTWGLDPPEAILLGALATLLIGVLPGLVNGWLVAYLQVPPFIATFAMMGICWGVSELLTEGVYATNLPDLAAAIGNGYLIYAAPGTGVSFFVPPDVERGTPVLQLFPNIAVIVIAVIAVAAFVLRKTRFGQHVYAIGGNKDAALRAGIRVRQRLLAVYVLSSVLASLAGISYALKFVSGKPDAGSSQLLDAIAAVVIGGASLLGGSGTVGRTVVGCLIIAVLETGLRIQGTPTFDKYVLVGVILIGAVIVEKFLSESRK